MGPNDLLIKIGAAGFCHTDYQVHEGVYKSPLPLIPSHEPVGTIVAIGPQAAKSGKWKVGQHVGALGFQHQCHECLMCKTFDDIKYCEKKEMKGLVNDGAMGEYMVSDPESTLLLPEGLEFEQAAPLMCAGVSLDCPKATILH